MNFENIFILPNVIWLRSRRRFRGIFIKIPKVTSARSSLMYTAHQYTPPLAHLTTEEQQSGPMVPGPPALPGPTPPAGIHTYPGQAMGQG